MKKIVVALLFLSSFVFGLEWEKDLQTAFERASKEQKVLMVMVESKTCRWCKKMKGRTLSDEQVEKRLEKFVLVKVMRENAQEMSQLPAVRGVPTIFFMRADKAVLEEVIGYFNVEDFISYINDVEKKM